MRRVQDKTRFRVAAGVVVTGAIAWLAYSLHAPQARTVSFEVSCASGQPVEGVWVAASVSTPGWAIAATGQTGRSQATYSYLLALGGTYQVRVGCGGTTKVWAHQDVSEFISYSGGSFSCRDSPDSHQNGTCVPLGSGSG